MYSQLCIRCRDSRKDKYHEVTVSIILYTKVYNLCICVDMKYSFGSDACMLLDIAVQGEGTETPLNRVECLQDPIDKKR